MKEISAIVDEALSHAHGCLLNSQATEAGHLFGIDLVDSESSQDRRSAIQTALANALPQTTSGSHARAFMIAVVSALDDAWGLVS